VLVEKTINCLCIKELRRKVYYDVAATQINYPILNKQNSIEQVGSRSHEEGLVQIFMLYDMQLGGF
jgi:hypothetical protein